MNKESPFEEIYVWALKHKYPLNQRQLHRHIYKIFCGPIIEYSNNLYVVLSAYRELDNGQ